MILLFLTAVVRPEYLPGGEPDPKWRGCDEEMNALFADLFVSTGMRLGEDASLLIPEIPPLRGRHGTGRALGLFVVTYLLARRQDSAAQNC